MKNHEYYRLKKYRSSQCITPSPELENQTAKIKLRNDENEQAGRSSKFLGNEDRICNYAEVSKTLEILLMRKSSASEWEVDRTREEEEGELNRDIWIVRVSVLREKWKKMGGRESGKREWAKIFGGRVERERGEKEESWEFPEFLWNSKFGFISLEIFAGRWSQ